MRIKTASFRSILAVLIGSIALTTIALLLVPRDSSAQIPGHTTITLSRSSTVSGQISVTGALSKGSGTFVIDHPLDPKNMLLYHSFVESPDVKNVYDGIAELDASGGATVELPRYFLALNRDFRYLATPMSSSMPELHLASGVSRKYLGIAGPAVFRIEGGVPGGTVSWQVTGVRHDPFILANPIIPEVEKTDETFVMKGECVFGPNCL